MASRAPQRAPPESRRLSGGHDCGPAAAFPTDLGPPRGPPVCSTPFLRAHAMRPAGASGSEGRRPGQCPGYTRGVKAYKGVSLSLGSRPAAALEPVPGTPFSSAPPFPGQPRTPRPRGKARATGGLGLPLKAGGVGGRPGVQEAKAGSVRAAIYLRPTMCYPPAPRQPCRIVSQSTASQSVCG